jgi:xanthine dehydrogenase YagS FAD-binding subunit
MLPSFDYIRPKSVQAAITHLAAGSAQAHAGGTDLMGCLRERIFPIGKVVSLSGLSELRGVRETADGGLRIGALTTLSAIVEHPAVIKRLGALAQAA